MMLVQKSIVFPIRSTLKRYMATKCSANELLFTKEVHNNGLIVLNRPKALDAANLEMLENLAITLNYWKDTKSLIIVRANGGKEFCAGGNVRAMVQSGSSYGIKMAKTLYATNHIIRNLKIPFITLIDGSTIGTGHGLLIHGKYRIATENTVFVMPKPTNGLFPDIGASYFLPRLQGKLGYLISLTGTKLTGRDVWHTGIATHYCDSVKISNLEYSLLHLNSGNDVDSVINDFCPKSQSQFSLTKNLDQINECFDAASVDEIICKLKNYNSEWATKTIQSLRINCQPGLKVALEQLNFGAKMSLNECLQLETRLFSHLSKDTGRNSRVRTMLISKNKPRIWSPPCIEDIPAHRVLSFFQPTSNYVLK